MANDKEAKNKKETKNKKSFFKDFKAELKKVIWPTPKQLINSTIAVVVIVLITAAIVLVLDVAFDFLNKRGINKIKAKVRGIETEQVVDENNENAENSEETENTENAVETLPIENNTGVSDEVLEKLNESIQVVDDSGEGSNE